MGRRAHFSAVLGWAVSVGAMGMATAVLGAPAVAAAANPAPPVHPAIVSHVKVLSDKVEDVSSLEAWKKSFIKDSMSDREKALTIWENVYRFRHQCAPPNEFVDAEGNPHDPIKDWNVYGYGMCCCASANVEALARYVGLEARGWGITAHSVPEVKWEGKWHLLDSSLITYFPKADGDLAGVEEIAASINDWYAQNPKFKGSEKALTQMMREGGWKNGPEMLKNCPTYDNNGWLPAATHGWYSTMSEYGSPAKNFVYEYGTALGYEVNVQLRPGEKLTRNWGNKGLHVNGAEGQELGLLKQTTGKEDLRYTPKHGDLAPGRVGNGVLEYEVPVKSADLTAAALSYVGLAADQTGLGCKDAGAAGELVLRMPSSYVYLSGMAEMRVAMGIGGKIEALVSDNNGLDWKSAATITAAGTQKIDLKALVYRKYDYRLKLVLTGAGTKIEALKLTHDVQHSQRTLPALAEGKNTITFDAGAQEGTITIQGSTNPKFKGKNLLYTDFHTVVNGLKEDLAFLKGAKGDVTWPVVTPGDIKRIRVGAHYRARGVKDHFDVQVSFDEGKSWKEIGKLDGPTPGNSKYFVFSEIPAGARSAQVRLAGSQQNTLGFHDVRIDADYAEPAGGFAPVKVTYVWEENGVEKRDEHVAKQASESYTIQCAGKPGLKSLIVERAE